MKNISRSLVQRKKTTSRWIFVTSWRVSPGYPNRTPKSGYPNPKSGYPNPKSGYPNPEDTKIRKRTPKSGHPNPKSGYPNPKSGYPSPGYPNRTPKSGHQNPDTLVGYPNRTFLNFKPVLHIYNRNVSDFSDVNVLDLFLDLLIFSNISNQVTTILNQNTYYYFSELI